MGGASVNGTSRVRDKDATNPSQLTDANSVTTVLSFDVNRAYFVKSCVLFVLQAWNPAAEDQCFDRCHRLGQTKDVIVTKVSYNIELLKEATHTLADFVHRSLQSVKIAKIAKK